MLLIAVVVVLALIVGGHVGYRRGVSPLRKLKPGTYRVRAEVTPRAVDPLLVISWPEDWGLEYRLVCLRPATIKGGTPHVGTEIHVFRATPGVHFVHPAVPVHVGDMS